MIDWDRVSQLQEEVGEDDFQEVVDMFLDEVNGEIDSITREQSSQELEAKLHFLKGAALNLGLKAFADLCRVGEDLARDGKKAEVDKAAIVTCYRASMEEFSTVLGSSAAA